MEIRRGYLAIQRRMLEMAVSSQVCPCGCPMLGHHKFLLGQETVPFRKNYLIAIRCETCANRKDTIQVMCYITPGKSEMLVTRMGYGDMEPETILPVYTYRFGRRHA